jgi:hypothetical protein
MGKKDHWNTLLPADDKQFASYVAKPELAALLPSLYPGVFPNLDALSKSGKTRTDLEAILLTGIPSGLIPGFQNYTGSTQADMLRLNTAIKPTATPSIYGLLGGDLAGFPNGCRMWDDVVAIERRALAGATYALVDKTYTPDAAAGAVTDGLTPADLNVPYLRHFPTSASRTAVSPRPPASGSGIDGSPGARHRRGCRGACHLRPGRARWPRGRDQPGREPAARAQRRALPPGRPAHGLRRRFPGLDRGGVHRLAGHGDRRRDGDRPRWPGYRIPPGLSRLA